MTDNNITLTLPAVPDFVRLARLTVASLATKVGFSYDEVEDLRIAVGEGCSLLIGPDGGSGTLTLRFRASPTGLDVQMDRAPSDAALDGEGSDLSAQILDAVVDRYEFSSLDGHVSLSKAVGTPSA